MLTEYEKHIPKPQLVELRMDEVEPELTTLANKAKKTQKKDLVNFK